MKTWDFKSNCVIEHSLSFGSRSHGDEGAVFDFNERRYLKPWSYNRKQRRAFHRCISGLLRAKGRLERIRFMTLTSSLQSDMVITKNRFLSELIALPATSLEDNMTFLKFLLEEGLATHRLIDNLISKYRNLEEEPIKTILVSDFEKKKDLMDLAEAYWDYVIDFKNLDELKRIVT